MKLPKDTTQYLHNGAQHSKGSSPRLKASHIKQNT